MNDYSLGDGFGGNEAMINKQSPFAIKFEELNLQKALEWINIEGWK